MTSKLQDEKEFAEQIDMTEEIEEFNENINYKDFPINLEYKEEE